MKKGFTLVEMLITIAVLGTIILIVTPNMTGLLKKVEQDKYDRFLNDVFLATEAYIQANADLYPAIKVPNEKVYIYFEDLISSHYLKSDVFDPKNKKKVSEEHFTVEIYLNDDDEYSYQLFETKMTIPLANHIVAPEGATYKGIIFLDTTNPNKACTVSDVNANLNSYSKPTEVITGCMRWYVFDESGDTYKMILDHNTTARVKWDDYNSNVDYDSSNVKEAVDNLVTVSDWKVTPRLITGQEVAGITNKTDWNQASTGTWFYFETKTTTIPTFDSTTRSKYDWLFNNSGKCKSDTTDYGCTLEDGQSYTGYGTAVNGISYGYWTHDQVGESGSGSKVWAVTRHGRLVGYDAQESYFGVRPVI